ncbi:hypothetical protein K7432_012982 [Basidiobolus ranarum]|uniref:Uncharacterized protein n=1 Tax=Basidiobolus ranarum TaxID=34480 RepID=A0ABR2WK15_9FUNG
MKFHFSVLNLLIAGLTVVNRVQCQQDIDFEQLLTMTRGRHIEVIPSEDGSGNSDIIIIVKDPDSPRSDHQDVNDRASQRNRHGTDQSTSQHPEQNTPNKSVNDKEMTTPTADTSSHGQLDTGNQAQTEVQASPSSQNTKPAISAEVTKTNIGPESSRQTTESRLNPTETSPPETPGTTPQIPTIVPIPVTKPTATNDPLSIPTSASQIKSASTSSSLPWSFSRVSTGTSAKPTNVRPSLIPPAISEALSYQLSYLHILCVTLLAVQIFQ